MQLTSCVAITGLGTALRLVERTTTPEPVVDALLRASAALVSISARSLSSVSEDVTLPQFRTLVLLATRGPLTVSAIAEGLDVHASTMTRMCNRLVTRGLVVRTPSATDRREVVITLSTSGQDLVDDVTARRRAEFDAIVERIEPVQREAVVAALEVFADAARDDELVDLGVTETPESIAPSIRMLAPFSSDRPDEHRHDVAQER
jgi:DNA-binding MarR family transcriptional regulator